MECDASIGQEGKRARGQEGKDQREEKERKGGHAHFLHFGLS